MSTKIMILAFGALAAFGAARAEGEGRTPFSADVGNPVCPGYVGDPYMLYEDGTFYVYGTTDGWALDNGKAEVLSSGPYCVRESKDLVHWKTTPFSKELGTFPKSTNKLWAPTALKGKDGKWYLYYIHNGYNCFVATGPSPRGPWTDLNKGNPLAPYMFDTDVVKIDGRVFVITMNGSREKGTWGIHIGELNNDMVTWKRPLALAYTGKDLFEGPGLFKRGKKWYLTYSNGSLSGSYHVNYAMADDPFGPYVADKANNPIIQPDWKGTGINCTGHCNVFAVGKDYYLCYHRRSCKNAARMAGFEKIAFREDGTIVPMKPTLDGERPKLKSSEKAANLALKAVCTASSCTEKTQANPSAPCTAQNAADRNYGTVWAPATSGEEWLQLDLGTVKPVSRVVTSFELDGAVYRYVLETSVDGKKWSKFADRSASDDPVNPRTDAGKARARYLRFRFNGAMKESPGGLVGVNEVKVY